MSVIFIGRYNRRQCVIISESGYYHVFGVSYVVHYVVHIKHFIRPQIYFFLLLLVDGNNSRVENLKALAGGKQSNAFGILCTVYQKVSCGRTLGIIVTVTVCISGHRAVHNFTAGNIAENRSDVVNRTGKCVVVAYKYKHLAGIDSFALG